MGRCLVTALLLVGCTFSTTIDQGQQPGADTKPIDAAIDAKPLPACPTMANCVSFKNCEAAHPESCYYYCSSTETWQTSQNACQNIPGGGGCLVTLNDEAESACVVAGAGGSGLIYIGLRQPGGSSEPSGSWGWQCGSSSIAPMWNTGEPNDSGIGGEDCGATDTNGKWVDVGCGEQFRFVCEKPRPAS